MSAVGELASGERIRRCVRSPSFLASGAEECRSRWK